jgi:hypothetical protein
LERYFGVWGVGGAGKVAEEGEGVTYEERSLHAAEDERIGN